MTSSPASTRADTSNRELNGQSRPPIVAALTSKPWLEAASVACFFLVSSIVVMWPSVVHPSSLVYGFGNDNLGGMRFAHAVYESFWHGVSLQRELQFPFGYSLPNQAIQPIERGWNLLFGGPGNGALVQNAQIFASFVLSGCTMYLLARYVTRSRAAALVAGFAYTFSPFHLAIALQYTALSAIQWIPLYLLALLVLLRRGRTRDAVLCGLAFALVVLNSYYYAWLTAWVTGGILIAASVRWMIRRRRSSALAPPVRPALLLAVRRAATAGAVTLVTTTPLLLSSAQAAGDGTAVGHPLSEAVRYSARPWMLVLPPIDNPLWGGTSANFVQQHLFDAPVYEQSLYLGLVLTALAIVGIWRWGPQGALNQTSAAARFFLVSGVVVAAIVMIGPYIPLQRDFYRNWANFEALRKIPSIGLLIFEIGPIFRFFSRAFVLVSACLAPLAAIGLARLLRRIGPSVPKRWALTALVVVAIGVEFANQPPRVFMDLREPAWVAATRQLPAGAPIVDYPVASLNTPRSLYYLYWQSAVDHPTANPFDKREAVAFAAKIADPDSAASGQALSRAGIRYAIVHTRLPPQTSPPYQPGLPDDSMPRSSGSSNPWFERVAATPDSVIYRIRKPPPD